MFVVNNLNKGPIMINHWPTMQLLALINVKTNTSSAKPYLFIGKTSKIRTKPCLIIDKTS